MRTFPTPSVLNGTRLREELAAGGVVVAEEQMLVVGSELRLDITAAQDAAAGSVVAAHTGQSSTADVNRQVIVDAYTTDMAKLQSIIDSAALPASPTTAQRDAATRQVIDACKDLARVQRRVLRYLRGDYTGAG